MSVSRLECPICQQNLVRLSNEGEEEGDIEELTLPTHRRRSAWSWSPVSTPCGHLFHKGCLLEWFRVRRHNEGCSRVRGSCPTCRKFVTYPNLVRLYLTSTSSDPNVGVDLSSNFPATFSTPTNSQAASASTSTANFSSATSSASQTNQHNPGNDEDPLNSPSFLSARDRMRMFSEFFNLCVGRRSQHELIRLRSRLLTRNRQFYHPTRDDDDFMNIACDNSECVDLREAFYILVRECKSLKRKLELEVDVSKMKSVLVASQQRDIMALRKRRHHSIFSKEFLEVIGLALLLIFWVIVIILIAIYLFPGLVED